MGGGTRWWRWNSRGLAWRDHFRQARPRPDCCYIVCNIYRANHTARFKRLVVQVRSHQCPRIPLGHLAHDAGTRPRLAAALGLGEDDLWIKRDDLTGLAGGGNKIRTLEFTAASRWPPGRARCDGGYCAEQPCPLERGGSGPDRRRPAADPGRRVAGPLHRQSCAEWHAGRENDLGWRGRWPGAGRAGRAGSAPFAGAGRTCRPARFRRIEYRRGAVAWHGARTRRRRWRSRQCRGPRARPSHQFQRRRVRSATRHPRRPNWTRLRVSPIPSTRA
jgi:hypothetical protein